MIIIKKTKTNDLNPDNLIIKESADSPLVIASAKIYLMKKKFILPEEFSNEEKSLINDKDVPGLILPNQSATTMLY